MKKFIKNNKKNIILFLVPFTIFMIIFLAYYPGIITYDGNNQWAQVQSGLITDAHPFLTTYFMFLLSKIWNDPRIVIIIQIIIISFIWMIICKKTRNESNFKKQVIYTTIVSFIPIIALYSITMWKDILYSYYLIMLGFMTYDVALKNDFKNIKKFDLLIIGLLSFLVFSYRHNGMLVAILYLVIFGIIYLVKNKKTKQIKDLLIVILTFLIMYTAVLIPKRYYLNKIDTSNKDEAITTVDMYITWIFGNYIKHDVVSKKDLKFLNNAIEINRWKNSYNSFIINDTFMPSEVNVKYINDNKKQYRNLFIKYTLKNPLLFIKHYLDADALLISLNSQDYSYVYVYPFENWEYLSFGNMIHTKIPILEKVYTKGINLTFKKPFKYFYQPGLILYICIILAIILSRKYKNKEIWYLLVPMLLNTLSLLPTNVAQDLRYVYINYLTLVALGLIYVTKTKKLN